MMKIRFLAKLAALAQLCLLITYDIKGGYTLAQTHGDEQSVEFPAINHNLVINLDNLFQDRFLGQESDQLISDRPGRISSSPMRLVGTLIMGNKKFAWIKTHEFQIHVLEHGQRVPGSELRINRILTDSVELVNADNCHENSLCKQTHVLDLD